MSFDNRTGQPSGTQTGTGQSGTAQTARDEASNLAHNAADSGRDVLGEAKTQARGVAAEAGQQAKNLLGEAQSQLAKDTLNNVRTDAMGQVSQQKQKAAGGIRTFSDDLRSMSEGAEGGLAVDLARQLADRSGSVASWIDDREPGDLVDELKRFARRRPGVFLAAAVTAGVLAGRLTRGAKDAASDDGDSLDRPTAAHRAPGAPSTPAGQGVPSAGTGGFAAPGTVPPVQPSAGPVGGPTPVTHTPAGTPSTTTGTAAGAPRAGVEGEGLR